jgi:hypothetical protein
METEILKYSIQYGIFAVLFIWLFFDTRRDSKEREKQLHNTIGKNQSIIQDLAKKYDVLNQVKDDVEVLKEDTSILKADVALIKSKVGV